MNLIIDIGNTLQKIAVFDHAGQFVFLESYLTINQENIEKIMATYPIQHCLLSAVSDFDKNIISTIKKKCSLLLFSTDLQLPLTIDYANKDSLGSDRIANAVAAHHLYPNTNILSIQAGSCIVADFIDKSGTYHGGSISPGLNMRFKALHTFTAHLPSIELQDIDFFMGNSTEKSILSGVINGVIDEINSLIERYTKVFDDLKVILTGGDASYLQKSIKNTIFADSNLVLIGLNKILKINVENK